MTSESLRVMPPTNFQKHNLLFLKVKCTTICMSLFMVMQSTLNWQTRMARKQITIIHWSWKWTYTIGNWKKVCTSTNQKNHQPKDEEVRGEFAVVARQAEYKIWKLILVCFGNCLPILVESFIPQPKPIFTNWSYIAWSKTIDSYRGDV